MKICVLVKEVPDAAVEKRIHPQTGRMDRGGERNLNPYDTHAIEAAMQVKEGGVVDVEEIVAVTMGPGTAVRALHKAVSLGADRSVHLSDDALAGSDVAATGYALAKVLERESPDLVLLGQQRDDPRHERHVRAGEDRQPDGVGVLLDDGLDDLLGRLVQAGVDDLHARVAQRASDDLCAAIVAVEAGLGDDDADLLAGGGVLRHSCPGAGRMIRARR